MTSKTSTTTTTTKREIAFIDRHVDDLPTLLAGLRPEVEPILLSDDEPAPRQMARAVQGITRGQLDAIHVIAHGRPGEVCFGAGVLSADTLGQYAVDLVEIGFALGGGNLFLWSCNTAQGERGAAFVEELSDFIGVDLIDTEGLIGSAARGGTRDLNARSGAQIDERPLRVPLSEAALSNYGGVMPNHAPTTLAELRPAF